MNLYGRYRDVSAIRFDRQIDKVCLRRVEAVRVDLYSSFFGEVNLRIQIRAILSSSFKHSMPAVS